MRRLKLLLAALSVAVASFAAFSGPALADDVDCRDARGDLIRCDGDLYAPYYYDNDDDFYFDNDYYDRYFDDDFYFFDPNSYFFSPYYFDDYYDYGCEGPVCLID